MVEGEEVSSDGLTWTFKLRSGLKFHDGAPVTSKDVVASLIRWSARDPMGLMIRAIQNELVAVDDRTFKWSLKQPFPKMLLALGKNNSPCSFIMPERIAKTDPFQQITEYVGSGPMKFLRNEWVPGAKAVFEKWAETFRLTVMKASTEKELSRLYRDASKQLGDLPDVTRQFFTDLRTNKFNPFHIQRGFGLCLQRFHNLITQCCHILAFNNRQTYQYILRRAEILYQRIFIAAIFQRVTNGA